MDMRLKFNEDELNYDQYRPEYPGELFKDIFKYHPIDKSSKVLEIGIGTGQATKPFLETDCSVSAIELGDRLSAFVSEKYAAYENFQVHTGDFMKTKISPDTYDLVYCATAFHWLPEKALDKVKKILKPDGCIALFWNHPFPNKAEDQTNLASMKIYQKYRPSDQAQIEFSKANCKIYQELLEEHGYRNIDCKLYSRVRHLSSDEYIHLLNTYSDHRALKQNLRLKFEHDMLEELDKVEGSINIYDTLDLYLGSK